MAEKKPTGLQREEVYRGEVVEGRPLADSGLRRLWQSFRDLLVSSGERAENDLDERLKALPGVTRPNVIAVISPKGGVGKTTNTFLIGNMAPPSTCGSRGGAGRQPGLRHARPRWPPTACAPSAICPTCWPTGTTSRRGGGAQLRLRWLPTGLHLLAAPMDPKKLAELTPAQYDAIVTYLSYFYEAILLDCGTGVADPLAQFAIGRAEQVVLVTTPEGSPPRWCSARWSISRTSASRWW